MKHRENNQYRAAMFILFMIHKSFKTNKQSQLQGNNRIAEIFPSTTARTSAEDTLVFGPCLWETCLTV